MAVDFATLSFLGTLFLLLGCLSSHTVHLDHGQCRAKSQNERHLQYHTKGITDMVHIELLEGFRTVSSIAIRHNIWTVISLHVQAKIQPHEITPTFKHTKLGVMVLQTCSTISCDILKYLWDRSCRIFAVGSFLSQCMVPPGQQTHRQV